MIHDVGPHIPCHEIGVIHGHTMSYPIFKHHNKFTYVWKRSPNPLLVEYPAHVQQSLNWFNYFLLEPHLFWQETTYNHPSEWNKRWVNLGSNTDLCSICYGSEQYPNLVLEGSSVHVSDWEFCSWSMKNWRNTNNDLSHAVTGWCLASNTGTVTLAKQSASVKGDLQRQLCVFWTIGTLKNCQLQPRLLILSNLTPPVGVPTSLCPYASWDWNSPGTWFWPKVTTETPKAGDEFPWTAFQPDPEESPSFVHSWQGGLSKGLPSEHWAGHGKVPNL